jgi:hypothetical protein
MKVERLEKHKSQIKRGLKGYNDKSIATTPHT